MKKKLALLLALVMIIALAVPVSAFADDNVEISLWTYPIGKWTDEATVKGFIEAFNAEYPNITVKVEYLDYTNGDDKINTAIEGGQAPDIVMEGPERLIANWGAKGLMVDLADLMVDGVYEGVSGSCTSADGRANAICTVTVSYTPWQWVKHYVLFGWLWE